MHRAVLIRSMGSSTVSTGRSTSAIRVSIAQCQSIFSIPVHPKFLIVYSILESNARDPYNKHNFFVPKAKAYDFTFITNYMYRGMTATSLPEPTHGEKMRRCMGFLKLAQKKKTVRG
jgi:hypothetical protein